MASLLLLPPACGLWWDVSLKTEALLLVALLKSNLHDCNGLAMSCGSMDLLCFLGNIYYLRVLETD